MKTTRIANGYYKGTYKGQDVVITKTWIEWSNETLWYFEINGEDANDYVTTKKMAILSAMDMIDNANEYGLDLK